MNNCFSWRRVMLYARKNYSENGRNYLYGILALLTAVSFILLFIPQGSEVFLPVVIMLAAVFCIQIGCRSHYSRNSIETNYTLPVTTLEKYLFIWVNTVVIGTLVILAITMPLSYLSIALKSAEYGLSFADITHPLVLLFFGAQAAALFTCCWVKGSPVKGYLLAGGTFVLFILVYIAIWRYSIHAYNVNLFDSLYCYFFSSTGSASVSSYTNSGLPYTMAIFGVWIPALWLAAYFKFKERTLK